MVSLKLTDEPSGVVAETWKPPVLALAVKAGAMAMPLALVATVQVRLLQLPPKVPDGLPPPKGAWKVTLTFWTGAPPRVTVTSSTEPYWVLTRAVWLSPWDLAKV